MILAYEDEPNLVRYLSVYLYPHCSAFDHVTLHCIASCHVVVTYSFWIFFMRSICLFSFGSEAGPISFSLFFRVRQISFPREWICWVDRNRCMYVWMDGWMYCTVCRVQAKKEKERQTNWGFQHR